MDVFLHIGLAKTGTTALQRVLHERRDRLQEHGVRLGGGSIGAQMRAAYDVLGRRLPGPNPPDVAGSFRRLVEDLDASTAPRAIVSQEILALARPRQVRRVLSALSAHDVYVVVTVRDLGRAVCSAWQQEIFEGRSSTFADYVAAIREPVSASPGAAAGFWLRQDVVRVLRPWQRMLGSDHVIVVTVPPPGSSAQLLYDRFADVLHVPGSVLRTEPARRNPSLGAAEVEVLRRLNTELAGRRGAGRAQLLKPGIREKLADPGGRPIRLPDSERTWVTHRAATMVEHVRTAGYRVVGDLTDLTPFIAPPEAHRSDDFTSSELLAATERTLSVLAVECSALSRRAARLQSRIADPSPAGGRGLYHVRSVGFRTRRWALEQADRNRLVGWATRMYVRHGSSHRETDSSSGGS